MRSQFFWFAAVYFLLMAATQTWAQSSGATPMPEIKGEAIEVDKIKEKYWAKGDEAELGVVQNRRFSNSGKFSLGAFGGIVSSDPFLSVKNYGASFGYFMNQFFSVHALYWKTSVGASSALKTFQKEMNSTTNTNEPRSFYGLQGGWNFMYGKLSLLGKAIIYFDLFLRTGVGMTSTESGSYLTPFLGLGQQVHLSKNFSVTLDYRYMRYEENIKGKVPGPNLDRVVGKRVNVTDAITAGVAYTF